MRSHCRRRVLMVTMAAAAIGAGRTADAASFVHRPLTLSRSDFALDLGLGIGHQPGDVTGVGLNFELEIGLSSFLQLGVRSGARLGTDGRRTHADEYGRPFETETYGTGGESVANPEISLRWSVLRSAIELALESRLYIPIEDGTRVGMMLAVPMALHIGGSARLDTGVYVPILFHDPVRTVISFPFHLWIQASNSLYLGPMLGVRINNPGGHTTVPLGFGLGSTLAYNLDVRTWFLFPDVSADGAAKTFGAGIGLQIRF